MSHFRVDGGVNSHGGADARDEMLLSGGGDEPVLVDIVAAVRRMAALPPPEATGDLAVLLRDGCDPQSSPAAPRRSRASRGGVAVQRWITRAAATAMVLVTTFGGAAAAGVLPDPLQQWAHAAADRVDVPIPAAEPVLSPRQRSAHRPRPAPAPAQGLDDRVWLNAIVPAGGRSTDEGPTAARVDDADRRHRPRRDAIEERRDAAADRADDAEDAAEDRADAADDAAEERADDIADVAAEERDAAEDAADDRADARARAEKDAQEAAEEAADDAEDVKDADDD